jgi:hypothetical protein
MQEYRFVNWVNTINISRVGGVEYEKARLGLSWSTGSGYHMTEVTRWRGLNPTPTMTTTCWYDTRKEAMQEAERLRKRYAEKHPLNA